MQTVLVTLVWSTLKTLGILAFLVSPVYFGARHLHVIKARYKKQAVEPFTGQPLRPPGESLRLKIQDLDEQLNDEILVMVGLPTAVAAAYVTIGHRFPWQFTPIVFLLIVLTVLWRTRRLVKLFSDLRNHRLGFTGERVVGEELNQLMLHGYRVFHDLPFPDYNVDHIVVGPTGVYAIETKTKRKATDEKGRKLEWTVNYDGSALHFPLSGPEVAWLDQASRNARSVGDWLTKAVGARVTAQPVLIIPGWKIDRATRGYVNVLNEKEIHYSFPRTKMLSDDMIQRIAYQLSEKCRLPAAN